MRAKPWQPWGMPAGGPHDHWLTDLLNWNLPAFNEACDQLIVDIYRLGGHKQLEFSSPLGRRLDGLWWPPTRSQAGDPDLELMERDLRRFRDQLRRDAEAAGWELS